MATTKIEIQEDGSKIYIKECKFCKKVFRTQIPQQIYCCEQHKELAAKRKKSKSKSCKRYQKKHDVERQFAASCRTISRRLAVKCFPPVDFLTGESQSILDLQVHHIDGNPYNISIFNLAFLTAESHAKIHQMLKEEFGKEAEQLVEFGKFYENFDEEPQEVYLKERELRDKLTSFQLKLFKYRRSIPVPEFN